MLATMRYDGPRSSDVATAGGGQLNYLMYRGDSPTPPALALLDTVQIQGDDPPGITNRELVSARAPSDRTCRRYTSIMSFPKLLRAFFVLSLLTAIPASAFSDEGFDRIFDGETLRGWKALDMSYWSIDDEAITGRSTPDHPCTSNQFIVWQGGELGDFVLKLQFRVSGNSGNSGVQFRSVFRPDGLAVGYQADILQSGGYLGGVCDELHTRKGPELLSANGQKTVIDAAGNRTATPLGPMATMRPPGEWNDYTINAKGKHIVLEINGVKSTELFDQEEGHFDLGGLLGLQLRAGEPMTVQFKNIHLKKL